MVSQVSNQVTIREAAAKLRVSEQTIRRRLHKRLIKGHQENPPNGIWWVEVNKNEGSQEQENNNKHNNGEPTDHRALNELVTALNARVQAQDEELEARRREVQELHVLLGRSQETLPAPQLPSSPSWWRRLLQHPEKST